MIWLHVLFAFALIYALSEDENRALYGVNANPEQWEGIGATGKNFYYTDPDNGICVSTTGPATAADDSL